MCGFDRKCCDVLTGDRVVRDLVAVDGVTGNLGEGACTISDLTDCDLQVRDVCCVDRPCCDVIAVNHAVRDFGAVDGVVGDFGGGNGRVKYLGSHYCVIVQLGSSNGGIGYLGGGNMFIGNFKCGNRIILELRCVDTCVLDTEGPHPSTTNLDGGIVCEYS